MAVTSNFSPPRSGEIPHVDVTRDVNGDDRDDLAVPDVDGFWVLIQMSDGAFADPVKIGPSTEAWKIYAPYGYRHAPWVQGGRIHEIDYDRDGRTDLAFWNENHFEVHRQDEHGLFAPAATTFTTDVAFDSDDPTSLAAPRGIRHRRRDHMPTGAMMGSVLHWVGKACRGKGIRSDYGSVRLVLVLVGMLLVGARRLEHLQYVCDDPMLLRFCGLRRLPSRPTIVNWLKQFTGERLKGLWELNGVLVHEQIERLGLNRLTVDMDGTVVQAGNQVGWAPASV